MFVGGGYAGVEGIAELQDYVADLLERYPRCRLDGTRWILVEAEDRIMQEIPLSLAEVAMRELRGRGIEIRTGTRLERMDERTRHAHDRRDGPRPHRRLDHRGQARPGGPRARPAADRRRPHRGGRHDAGARARERLGDRRRRRGARPGQAAASSRARRPPSTRSARARWWRDNVAATLSGGKLRRFRYRTLGVFVDMGQHKAVATMLGVRLRGFPAWFAARTYHLMAMPGTARRLRLMADWTVGLFFGRASAELGQLGHPPSLATLLREPRRPSEAEA